MWLRWSLLWLAGCAATRAVLPAASGDRHEAATVFMARAFEAVQHVRLQQGEQRDEGQAQLWLQPGVGFRLRLLSPFAQVLFEAASYRCVAFEKRAGQATKVVAVSAGEFPFRALTALLAPLADGVWQGDTWVEAHRRVELGSDGRVNRIQGEQGVAMTVERWGLFDGIEHPATVDLRLPGERRLRVDNQEVTFVVNRPSEAVPELVHAAEACQ